MAGILLPEQIAGDGNRKQDNRRYRRMIIAANEKDPERLLFYLCFHDQDIPEIDDCSAAPARTPIPAASIGANIA
jgi:hypothetical protein